MALFFGHGELLWRFLHVFFGIIWIGTLYYFNFMQTPFFAETDGNTKNGAIQKLLPRALWWFRWGAMFTFLTGLFLLGAKTAGGIGSAGVDSLSAAFVSYFTVNTGIVILPGMIFGITMFLNVWLIIWPNQKIVIASTNAVVGGGKADPAAANSAARAAVVSRTNTLFSVPMLFFMISAAHMVQTGGVDAETLSQKITIFWTVTGVFWLVAELNAIFGKLVAPLKTVRNVLLSGFISTIAFYVLWEVLFNRPTT